ncbi:hypothetical protein QQX09_08760 [Demequina sp. SYSU T00192]|uniref:Uncharacterized protein n=1 Tax=Demequina litoralis TaxID=3051660 RepID=A0ABT8G9Y2_9MICO|nr:hypothetical protein [Demequina sp. SYSU T00192]MDN4475943.1 hypothetical protein [Demequina sp. SYSU T00192]
MSAPVDRPRDSAPFRKGAPTRRAALAGIVLAAVALAAVGVAAVWERPARVPTYEASAWTGDAVAVADYAQVAPHGLFAACPTATLGDGSTAGLLLVDGWSAAIPGIGVGGGGSVAYLRGPDGLALPDGFDLGGEPIMGRVLEAADPADRSLAESWTAACGEVDAVVLVAPGSSVHFPTLMN